MPTGVGLEPGAVRDEAIVPPNAGAPKNTYPFDRRRPFTFAFIFGADSAAILSARPIGHIGVDWDQTNLEKHHVRPGPWQ